MIGVLIIGKNFHHYFQTMSSEYDVLPDGFEEANERGNYTAKLVFNAFETVEFHAPKLILCGEIFNSQIQEIVETITFLMSEVERLNERINELERKK